MKKNRLTVGLIIPHYQKMFSTFYTLEIIKEVSRAAIRENVDLLIETAGEIPAVSGILFADVMDNELAIKRARRRKIPYIILNYYNKDSAENCIGIDNEKAGFEAVDYLVASGHRRVAIITGKLTAQAGIQRLEGFKRALRERGIDLNKRYVVTGDWSKESGRRAMKRLLNLRVSPTAVFAAGDEMALGAIKAIEEAGLRIRKDISLFGFDNIPEACSARVSLSTIGQPLAELAEFGVSCLVKVIRKRLKQPVKILLGNTRLIKRTSVKELKA